MRPRTPCPSTGAGVSPLTEVTAGHTLFLEEWELEPGDVISYYAVARITGTEGPRKPSATSTSSMSAPSGGTSGRPNSNPPPGGEEQPPGEGEGGEQPRTGSLSELQREVVAATFNLLRDQEGYSPEEFRENTVSVALAQGRVRDEVATLLAR